MTLTFAAFKSVAKQIPWQAILFLAATFMSVLADLKAVSEPQDFFLSLAYLGILAIVVILPLYLIFKDPYKAGNLATLFFWMFFAFRPVFVLGFYFICVQLKHYPAAWEVFVPWSAVLIGVSFLLVRGNFRWSNEVVQIDQKIFAKGILLFSVLLFFLNFCVYAQCQLAVSSDENKYCQKIITAFDENRLSGDFKPDIYFFLADALASESTFKEFWQFDASALPKYLQEQGFFVVDRAKSNYQETILSLPCTFNMNYMDPIIELKQESYNTIRLGWSLYQKAALFRVLKKLGYKIVNVCDAGPVTDNLESADINLQHFHWNMGCFWLFQNTPLVFLDSYFHVFGQLYVDLANAPSFSLNEALNISGPKFVYLHSELFHPPCIVGEHGALKPLPGGLWAQPGSPQDYIQEYRWGEPILQGWIAETLKRTHRDAVIVVQSDHGPYFPQAKIEDWHKERMRIINAVYLPRMKNKGLVDGMTPVNTFRVILNDYFKANLPMLPNKIYCTDGLELTPTDLKEVSQDLKP